jgi:hypothetical protein
MKYLLLIFGTFLLLTACQKEELKQPTDVTVSIDINREESTNGHLSFQDGFIRLASFSVEGTRQEGAEVELSREFEQGNLTNFSPTLPILNLDIDIPQGNYTELDIAFNIFDDNDQTTIHVEGLYTNQSNQTFPLVFDFASSEYFSINSEAEDGNPVITLDANISSSVLITLDPVHWFDSISYNLFDNATLVEINGVMTILVDENTNTAIYDIVIDRLDEQTSSVFSN